jgi:hypothetical protein
MRATSKKLYTNENQDLYRKRGKNKNSRGERRIGLTLVRIVLRHNNNFREVHPKSKRNGKNRVRTWQDHTLPLFCSS